MLKSRNVVVIFYFFVQPAFSQGDVWFNPQFINGDVSKVADIESLIRKNQAPGKYLVKVYLNDNYIDEKYLNFRYDNHKKRLSPCLKPDDLKGINLKSDSEKVEGEECHDIDFYVKDADAVFSFNELSLKVTVPQAYMRKIKEKEDVNIVADEGVDASFVKYFLSAQSNSESQSVSNYMKTGLNVSGWRVRDDFTSGYRYKKHKSEVYRENHNLYAAREIRSLRSQMTIGDTYTEGEILDGFQFTGLRLGTDSGMLESSLQNYSPVVRGYAHGNGKLTIRQNGLIMDVETVTQGDYCFDSINSAGAGDLNVTIDYSDGTVESFVVPYAYLPVMVKPGRFDSDIYIGEKISSQPKKTNGSMFFQHELKYGLSGGETIYSGYTFSEGYTGALMGISRGIPFLGAVSFDFAKSVVDNSPDVTYGKRIGLKISKELTEEQSLSFLFQHSPGGRYVSYGENNLSDINKYSLKEISNIRSQKEIIYRVSLLSKMNVNLRKRWIEYSNSRFNSEQTGVTLSTTAGIAYVSLNAIENRTRSENCNDLFFSLNLSLPLSFSRPLSYESSGVQAYLNSSISKNSSGSLMNSQSLSGSPENYEKLHYTLGTSSVGNSNTGYNLSAALSGDSVNSLFDVSSINGRNYYSMQASGAIVAAQGHLIATPDIGETNILVETGTSEGVNLIAESGSSRQYGTIGLISSASEYKSNKVTIDYDADEVNMDFENRILYSTPSRGAFSLVRFKPKIGWKGFFTVYHNRMPVPFGSQAFEKTSGSSGLVDENGVLYMNGLPESGLVKVSWGDGKNEHCTVRFNMKGINNNRFFKEKIQCN